MTERGVAVDHSTIYRWVQRFAPEMEKRLRRQWRRPQSRSWRVDETYIKVRGKWAYLYRAVDKLGNTIDFYLSATRNTKAAKRFLGKALRGLKEWEQPEVLNTDKAPAYAAAIAELKAEGKCPKDTRHRQVKYLNNVVEADHGKLKLLIRPVRGFKTLKTAYATIKGFEVMRALRKGQAGMFALQGGIVGEARIVERAFALGPCALTEAMALLQDPDRVEIKNYEMVVKKVIGICDGCLFNSYISRVCCGVNYGVGMGIRHGRKSQICCDSDIRVLSGAKKGFVDWGLWDEI